MSNPNPKPKTSDLKTSAIEVNIDAELSAIQTTIMDLTYSGFNAERVRKEVHDRLNPEEIVTLVSAYCQIGNNPRRATGKVLKPRADISSLLRRSETTLARVGLAFAALVRALRSAYPRNLGKRIHECRTPFDFQDPATAPYHETGRDFHDKFSKLIFNPNAKVRPDVDYFSIAVSNLDPLTVDLMRSDLSTVVAAIKGLKY
jgi:hypothetical protein